MSTVLEQISNGLTQLIKESDYLVSVTSETFGVYSVIYIIPAFRVGSDKIKKILRGWLLSEYHHLVFFSRCMKMLYHFCYRSTSPMWRKVQLRTMMYYVS